MTISATDSKGVQGMTAVELSAEELKKAGWKLQSDVSTGQPEPNAPKEPQGKLAAPDDQ
jgi:hypothetical protein